MVWTDPFNSNLDPRIEAFSAGGLEVIHRLEDHLVCSSTEIFCLDRVRRQEIQTSAIRVGRPLRRSVGSSGAMQELPISQRRKYFYLVGSWFEFLELYFDALCRFPSGRIKDYKLNETRSIQFIIADHGK